MRTGAGRHDDQFRDRDDRLDRHGDGRRGINYGQLETLLAQDSKIASEPGDGGLGKGRIIV